MKQLDLFSLPVHEQMSSEDKALNLPSLQNPADCLKINQVVVILPPSENITNIEDYYYLIDFAGKRGRIIEKHSNVKTISYSVEFRGGKCGVFYSHDLDVVEE